MSRAEILSVAVCLFNGVTALDYQGPVELFGFLSPENARAESLQSPRLLLLTFLSHSLDPVTPSAGGPAVVPRRTYSDVINSKTQYDILLIPGGMSGNEYCAVTAPNDTRPHRARSSSRSRSCRLVAVSEGPNSRSSLCSECLHRLLDSGGYRIP